MKLIERTHDIDNVKYTILPEHIKILIRVILEMIMEVNTHKEKLLKLVQEQKYAELRDASIIAKHHEWNPLLKQLKKELWDTCDASILNKIANNEPIQMTRTWEENHLLIPIEVLPTFSNYSDTFAKTDPKANAAQKLGAKLI